VIGAGVIIFWLLSDNRPSIALFATDTPTPPKLPHLHLRPPKLYTDRDVYTNDLPYSIPRQPPVGPFVYEVVEGDNLFSIAERFNVDLFVLIAINNLDPANPVIDIGDKLTSWPGYRASHRYAPSRKHTTGTRLNTCQGRRDPRNHCREVQQHRGCYYGGEPAGKRQ